jgi:hypothetical protein
MNYDVTVTIGSRPLVKAILGLIEPALSSVPGVYPLAVPGAADSGLRIDNVVTDVVGVGTTHLALSINAYGHLFGSVPAAVEKTVGFNALADLTHLAHVDLPFGQLTSLPLGIGDASQHVHDIPIAFSVTVPLAIHAATTATDHELVFVPGAPVVTTPAPADPAAVGAFLTLARDRVASLVASVLGPAATVTLLDTAAGGPLVALLGDLNAAATQRLTDTLSALPTISLGRLTAPGPGVSCATELVPTSAAVNLDVTAAHQFFLQIGLMLGGRSPAGATFPPVTPASTALDVSISNLAVLLLLCCMVQSLPNLVLPDAHETTDGTNGPLRCKWDGAVLNLGPAAFADVEFDLSIMTNADGSKTITLSGMFTAPVAVPGGVPVLGGVRVLNVNGNFSTMIEVDLDHLGRLTALKTPPVTASVGLAQAPALIGLLSSVPIIGFPWVEGAALAVQWIVEHQLNALIQTIFQPLKTLTSISVIPPGLLDVFGDLTSQLVTLDDLDVTGVAWAAPGLRRFPRGHFDVTHPVPGDVKTPAKSATRRPSPVARPPVRGQKKA